MSAPSVAHSIRCPAYLSPAMAAEGIKPGVCTCDALDRMINHGLFSADQHIESFQYNLQEREDDFVRALNDTISKVLADSRIRFAAFLGDVTNVKLENRRSTKIVREAFAKLDAEGVRVYTIRGNHDPEEVPFADIFGLSFVQDAEQAMVDVMEKGLAFKPYGENGPAVCAVGYRPTERLLGYLNTIRALEKVKGLPRSRELWMHGAVRPGAPDIAADLDVETLHALGWHTVVAGDIHNGGLWTKENGILVYTGSKEMTDINEAPETKGEYVHRPKGVEESPDIPAWEHIRYTSGRPYALFNFPTGITPATLKEINDWATAAISKSGMKPLITIITPEEGKELLKSPEIQKLGLRINVRRPKKAEEPTAKTEKGQIERQALKGRSLEEGLLYVAEKRKLTNRAREILVKTLTT